MRYFPWFMSAVGILGHSMFAGFILHPANLELYPWIHPLIAKAPSVFAQFHIMGSFLILVIYLWIDKQKKLLMSVPLLLMIGFIAEFVGHRTKFLFGSYEYTGLLGTTLFDIPILLPFAWVVISIPSFIIASYATRFRLHTFLFSLLLIVTWDLTIDPVMSGVFKYWKWEQTGLFYGVPLSNYLGWSIVGGIATLVLMAFRCSFNHQTTSIKWFLSYYISIIIFPFGISFLSRHYFAIGLTAVVVYVVRNRIFHLSDRDVKKFPIGT